MRDVKAPIHSSFQSTKHPSPSSGSCQPYIQEGPEGSWRSVDTFHVVLIPIDLICSCVDLMQVQFGEKLSKEEHSKYK